MPYASKQDKQAYNLRYGVLHAEEKRLQARNAYYKKNDSRTLRLVGPCKPVRAPDGYIKVTVGHDRRRQTLAHRVVVENSLGRLLAPNENVHHRNGCRHDNRIENLELWTRKQPLGQRVTDAVNWAREILTLYGDAA
jgi:hypothetical protein